MWRTAARPLHPLASATAPNIALAASRRGCAGAAAHGARGRLPVGVGRAPAFLACPLFSRLPSVDPLCRRSRGRPLCSYLDAKHDADSSSDSDFDDDCKDKKVGRDASQRVVVRKSPLSGTTEELDAWAGSADVQVHIHSSPASTPFDLSFLRNPGKQPPEEPPGWAISLVSASGTKGDDEDTPNQDAFSYTQLVGGWVLCIVCDGHGEHGEVISERVARAIPMLFAHHIKLEVEVEEALHLAFLEAQADLESCLMSSQVYSGTTVGMCCLNLDSRKAWFAHTGDSRVVLGDLCNGRVAFGCEEHKAHAPSEAKRLKKAGAQVVEKRYGDTEVISRVFIPRTGVPGLAMSRSLGDGCLKQYGVIADPDINDVSGFWNDCKAPVVVVASDGLWDYITIEEAISALAKRREAGVPLRLGAEVLVRRAQRLWIEEEDDYCDDTTVLMMAPNQGEK